MTIWHLIPAFAGVMLLGAMSPGPDFAVVLRRSAVSGPVSGMLAAAGVALGVSIWVIAAATGVASVLQASATIFLAVKIVGAGYLVYLGVQALWSAIRRSGGDTPVTEPEGADVPLWTAFRQGVMCNVLNPKAGVFFVALIPQFLPANPSTTDTVLLSAVAVAVTGGWFLLVAVLVGSMRRLFARPAVRRSLDAVAGTALVLLGVRLATGAR